jgi:hypothetical protein
MNTNNLWAYGKGLQRLGSLPRGLPEAAIAHAVKSILNLKTVLRRLLLVVAGRKVVRGAMAQYSRNATIARTTSLFETRHVVRATDVSSYTQDCVLLKILEDCVQLN